MAGVPQKTLNWLWDVLRREYRDPQRTYSDLVRTLTAYPSFAPRTDVYTFENGSSALLLHLNGTVSVNFRGTQYRFPIAIWVPQTYPYDSPMFFVTPTPEMAIRPGQYVSASDGRIYHPYLAQWKDAWERSTISDFVALLAEIFAKEPPVVAKRPMPDPRSQPPPRPPIPHQQQPANFSAAAPSGAPQLPPKPSAHANGATEQIDRGHTQRQSRYDVPPPLPQDAYNHNRQQSASPQTTTPITDPRLPARNPSLRDPYDRTPWVQPTPNNPTFTQPLDAQRPPIEQIQHSSQSPRGFQPQIDPRRPPIQQGYQQPPNQANPQAYPQHPPQQPYPPQQRPQQQLPPSQQPAKPKPVPDLMDDSPFDISLNTKPKIDLPIPVIPPNPEKTALLSTLSQILHQHLQTQIAQAHSAIPALQSQHAALSDAQSNMRSELSQLQNLQSQLNANISALNTTLSSADRTINSAKKQASENEITTIDEVIIPPTVLARQLYDSVAEQRGYEAAILALTEGLVRGRIGSDVWGRKTRECAREEFKRKWLVRRIGQGMALEGSDS